MVGDKCKDDDDDPLNDEEEVKGEELHRQQNRAGGVSTRLILSVLHIPILLFMFIFLTPSFSISAVIVDVAHVFLIFIKKNYPLLLA